MQNEECPVEANPSEGARILKIYHTELINIGTTDLRYYRDTCRHGQTKTPQKGTEQNQGAHLNSKCRVQHLT